MDEKLLSRLKLLAAADKDETLGKRLAHWTDNNDGITDAMNTQLTDEEHTTLVKTVQKIVIGIALGSLEGIAKGEDDPMRAMRALASVFGIMDGLHKHDGIETAVHSAFLFGFNLAYIDAPIPDAVPEKETKPEAQPETQA